MIAMLRTGCNPRVEDYGGYITAVGTLAAVSTVTSTAAINHCHLTALLDLGAYVHINTRACVYTNIDLHIYDGLLSLV